MRQPPRMHGLQDFDSAALTSLRQRERAAEYMRKSV
jgi:hypothetical protein